MQVSEHNYGKSVCDMTHARSRTVMRSRWPLGGLQAHSDEVTLAAGRAPGGVTGQIRTRTAHSNLLIRVSEVLEKLF